MHPFVGRWGLGRVLPWSFLLYTTVSATVITTVLILQPTAKMDLKALDTAFTRLTFHKNGDGKYHCPVTFKVFNENTHIVAVAVTGHVYVAHTHRTHIVAVAVTSHVYAPHFRPSPQPPVSVDYHRFVCCFVWVLLYGLDCSCSWKICISVWFTRSE
jgi:hypothetical protein